MRDEFAKDAEAAAPSNIVPVGPTRKLAQVPQLTIHYIWLPKY
jgi:hypothetical protein